MANSTDETNKNGNDEDNFGLPDLEYKPLDQLDTSKQEEQTKEDYSRPSKSEEVPVYEEEEESGGSSGTVIMVIVLLVILVGGFLAYKYVWLPRKAKMELAAKQKAEADKKAEEDRLAKVAEEERLKREAEAAKNAKPAEGTIESLSQRTGHYFVVISSSVDGDLAMDRAKKLSASGTSTKIIPPFGKWKYYRLCIGDFDSFASAQSSADASKAEYGDALWVIKY